MITVNNSILAVDYYVELEPYLDRFNQCRFRDNKLQSCSPFREDRKPSFAVNLENGTWIDSGAVGEYHKGHFITLLSFLREESAEDTCDYLINIYSPLKLDVSELKLDMSFLNEEVETELKIFTSEELKQYAYRHSYLESRGIPDRIQKLFRVGYDPFSGAAAMCWTNSDGQVVNIKFRSVSSKKFWYADGQRIKDHLYGYSVFKQVSADVLAITESEIDCMRLWAEGIPAVSLGSAYLSVNQAKYIFNCSIEELVIATDNDSAGERCAKQIEETFVGTFNVTRFNFEETDAKDISDLESTQIISGMANRKPCKFRLDFGSEKTI